MILSHAIHKGLWIELPMNVFLLCLHRGGCFWTIRSSLHLSTYLCRLCQRPFSFVFCVLFLGFVLAFQKLSIGSLVGSIFLAEWKSSVCVWGAGGVVICIFFLCVSTEDYSAISAWSLICLDPFWNVLICGSSCAGCGEIGVLRCALVISFLCGCGQRIDATFWAITGEEFWSPELQTAYTF